ncbi:MAG: hypothetical protein ACXAE3_05655 [Candidatus Kariarchaeaceae archaeon]|jgi:hypothetical protein
MSYQSRKQKDPLEIEADLYTAIATMDKLSTYFDKGYIGETLYRRQLKACVNDVYKARIALTEKGFDLDAFVARENLEEKFPEGLRRLDLVEGASGGTDMVDFTGLKEIPGRVADYVANSIELIDLLKLRSVAKVEYIVPLLDEMFETLTNFPSISKDHWSITEINGWRSELLGEQPSKVLPEEKCEKLEFDASRWLSDFRNKLKEL